MMEESLHGEFRLSSLGHGHHQSRRAVRLPRRFTPHWCTPYPALRHRSTRLASLDVPITHTTRRARNSHIAPLAAVRLIVAAIRRRCERARSRQQLRELSDHMLRDIGLRREDVGYEFPKPFWHD